jgi:hypothetical protein
MWWMAIPALLGAAAGGVAAWQNSEREKDAITQQKQTAWKQYELGQQHSDEQYAIQRGEALYQLGAQERALTETLGLSLDEYNTGLLAQAFGIQDARIQTSQTVGAATAAEGAGGTRGNAANELVRAYAAQGLERSITVQDRQNQNALDRLFSGVNQSTAAIAHERDSWKSGGYRFAQKESQDAYNLATAKLGQSNFNWQLEQAEPTFLDYATGILGGASSGMGMANSIYDFRNAWLDIGKDKDKGKTP